MVEPLDGTPPGTLGFRATGTVTADDYRDVLLPPLRAAAEAGEVRMVFAIGPGFEKFEPGALLEDSKVGLTLGLGHLSSWRRTALVTDIDWITKAFHMFAWMAPGEVMIRGLDGLEEAEAWVAG
jgi:hypothetical protein